jgi:hypothetical protein
VADMNELFNMNITMTKIWVLAGLLALAMLAL